MAMTDDELLEAAGVSTESNTTKKTKKLKEEIEQQTHSAQSGPGPEPNSRRGPFRRPRRHQQQDNPQGHETQRQRLAHLHICQAPLGTQGWKQWGPRLHFLQKAGMKIASTV